MSDLTDAQEYALNVVVREMRSKYRGLLVRQREDWDIDKRTLDSLEDRGYIELVYPRGNKMPRYKATGKGQLHVARAFESGMRKIRGG